MYDNNKDFYIAIDFDDTIVFAKSMGFSYPNYGYAIPGAIGALRNMQRWKHVKFLLWSCREGEELKAAWDFLTNNGIELAGMNCNPDPYWIKYPPQKIYYDLLIDDHSLDIPLTPFSADSPGFKQTIYIPDWSRIEALAKTKYTLWLDEHGLL